MDINFRELIKDKGLYVFLPIIVLVGLIGGVVYLGGNSFASYNSYNNSLNQLEELMSKKAQIERQIQAQEEEAKNPDLKKIYEVVGMKFGVQASFAPLFDTMLAIAKESGIRIRSAEYNYAPEKDPIANAKLNGYNVCELTTTVVGKYSEIQTFLKTLLAETYLINIAQVEIVSWQRDKSVLIANLKLRFYTKTN